MVALKLTKNELRLQEHKLGQLQKYLPTLQLKKAMLQMEINNVRAEIAALQKQFKEAYDYVSSYSVLFSQKMEIAFEDLGQIESIEKNYENIAGVEIPIFKQVHFRHHYYNLFDAPPWLEVAKLGLRNLLEIEAKIHVAEEKKEALQKEHRQVSIRVNLFEKVMIPRAKSNIKKIKVFLGDQQLAAVCQAKVAKSILQTKKEEKCAS